MHYIFPKKFAKILYISEPISEKTAFCSIAIKKSGHSACFYAEYPDCITKPLYVYADTFLLSPCRP